MNVIYKLITDDWDLIIRGNKHLEKVQKLKSVLSKRNVSLPQTSIQLVNPVYWHLDHISPGLKIPTSRIHLSHPELFENSLYALEIHFKGEVRNYQVKHSLSRINESFYSDESTLRGQLNFGNDIGWFRLPFSYEKQGKRISQAISFEIWPLKMDMVSDLKQIHSSLDRLHPYLKFSFAKPTEQSFQKQRNPYPPFDVLWIAQFQVLIETLYKGFKQVLQSPHNRLISENKQLKTHQLKGKISPKLAKRVVQNIKNNQFDKRYAVTQKHLSVDTPENRFIKFVLYSIIKKTENFSRQAQLSDNQDNPSLSSHFYEHLKNISKPFKKLQSHNLFKEIGDFNGSIKASLVLQQKTGYAAIFRSWQDLKTYLDVLGDDANISTKTVSELYEIWCFLEMAKILESSFGFKPKNLTKELGKPIKGFEFQARQLRFDFEKTTGNNEQIYIQLRHEKPFGLDKKEPKSNKQIVAWMTQHKPDIFMEIEFKSSGFKFVFLFDAKYRIDLDKNDQDWVPNDALYQMHRYRDALIYQERSDKTLDWNRSRPVYGAYALYPGYFEEQKEGENPYHQTINDIDIGAFAFLPGRKNTWLRGFLSEILGYHESKNMHELRPPYSFTIPDQAKKIKSRPSAFIRLR